jgi:hypothetical protein
MAVIESFTYAPFDENDPDDWAFVGGLLVGPAVRLRRRQRSELVERSSRAAHPRWNRGRAKSRGRSSTLSARHRAGARKGEVPARVD